MTKKTDTKKPLQSFKAFGIEASVWPPNGEYGETEPKIRIGRGRLVDLLAELLGDGGGNGGDRLRVEFRRVFMRISDLTYTHVHSTNRVKISWVIVAFGDEGEYRVGYHRR